MDPLSLGEAVAGGLLLFVVPGFVLAKAVFPERRARGPDAVRWIVELVALSLVLSVVLTILVGYVLLTVAPSGFSASWSDPLLEAVLAAIALVAFVLGLFEGAYAREPRRPVTPAEDVGEEGAWELSQRLGTLQRARLGLDRQRARSGSLSPEGAAELKSRREAIVAEEQELRERREAEYER